MRKPFFRLSCAVLLCCCLTGCGSIQHKSRTDTAQSSKAPPKTADDFSISSDSENETVDEPSSADAANASVSESATQQEPLTGAAALYSNGQEISFDPSWQYADFSAINSGTATIYLADSDRKDIVVGVNAGHGTSGGASVKTQCHPDGSPKTTGGSTAQGATYATAVSGGMTFNDGTAESTVTLQMAQILKDKLLAQGYDVLMVRNSDDVQLDNVARTVLCNNVADCHISLHWDGDGLGYDKGCFYISVPDGLKSMEPVASHWQEHNALGVSLVEGLRTEGMTIYQNGSMNIDLTQTSYSTIPSVDMELGNASSDHSDSTLNSLADGLTAGVNAYFGN
ncbi:N-acetylmuramoyl-L-alanine amidase [Mediterraneibacter faecis]|uniref:N-acetylmuramoyl-L-alanine amidase family protein n=1 Tax=Mediterraneibacter faecis TaxID=592978 RepID=UPI002ED411A9